MHAIYLPQHLPKGVVFDSKGWCIGTPPNIIHSAPFGRSRPTFTIKINRIHVHPRPMDPQRVMVGKCPPNSLNKKGPATNYRGEEDEDAPWIVFHSSHFCFKGLTPRFMVSPGVFRVFTPQKRNINSGTKYLKDTCSKRAHFLYTLNLQGVAMFQKKGFTESCLENGGGRKRCHASGRSI